MMAIVPAIVGSTNEIIRNLLRCDVGLCDCSGQIAARAC